ncbi:Branched-chain amino acid transport protein (AzlD) [Roseivivax jejudonensis]|uniref:Branched-chain amino acid transport protein (AzlD) n=1 Tax=Roseivivax jejudonensis TaxID=1529041 RepID=A0A1X6ZJN6_9RHOB|nr:AzlD domain-containing protein [Roseivivax jejudonensis]SLN53032.1 Branched-chain amino acid transport protein (AzlD) [Roseivivax jejudonensis]
MIETATLWTVIVLLGIGSFALRFVFLGFVGDRPLPPWLLRHLRYTAAAILPALVAPLVIWPRATDGETDPVRLATAITTLAVAYGTRNVLAAMGSGAAVLIAGIFFFN